MRFTLSSLAAPLALAITILVPGLALQAGNPPTIKGFSPTSGRPGTRVTITGTHFDSPQRVNFGNNLDAVFVKYSDTKIYAEVPQGAVPGNIRVITSAGTAHSSVPFNVMP